MFTNPNQSIIYLWRIKMEIWKEKARNKNINRRDVVAYCILRAVNAKSENKEEILKYFLLRSFSPGKVCSHRPTPYHALELAVQELNREVLYRDSIFESKEFFNTVDKIKFRELLRSCKL